MTIQVESVSVLTEALISEIEESRLAPGIEAIAQSMRLPHGDVTEFLFVARNNDGDVLGIGHAHVRTRVDGLRYMSQDIRAVHVGVCDAVWRRMGCFARGDGPHEGRPDGMFDYVEPAWQEVVTRTPGE